MITSLVEMYFGPLIACLSDERQTTIAFAIFRMSELRTLLSFLVHFKKPCAF